MGKRIRDYFEIMLLLFCMLLLIAVVSGKARIKAYVVQSGSMEPSVPTGSLCFVDTKYSYEDIKERDIIAYERVGSMLVMHRLIRKNQEVMETKGDANEVSDGYTSAGSFRGKVLFSLPVAGYLVCFFQTPAGVSVIGAAILGGLAIDRLKRKKEKKTHFFAINQTIQEDFDERTGILSGNCKQNGSGVKARGSNRSGVSGGNSKV